MKTPLQELMHWFNERPQYDKTSEGYEIMQKAQELLTSEAEHIIQAYDAGYVNATFKKPRRPREYYNLTFK